MDQTQVSRRTVLRGGLAVGAATVFAQPLKAAAPPLSEVTPALSEAARKEGKASFYTALELNTSERLARTFEAKYPGVAIRVERSGAERIYQRIIQEQASRIYAVDVVCSTDPSHFLDWTAKDKDWSRLMSPRTWQSIFRQTSSIRMACTRLCAHGSKSSATTPIW